MLAAVIPAHNEGGRISEVIRQLLKLPVGLVVPVLNGCTDMTAEVVGRVSDHRLRPLHFREALGYDVPRIAGSRAALEAGARAVLFVDGDLIGRVAGCLAELVDGVRRGLDLALCDCYVGTPVPYRESAAHAVYAARAALNTALGRADLGVAIPSHGPVAVSRRLLETVPPSALGVPPLMQARACRAGLKVGVSAALGHRDLGSAGRDREHRLRIADTLVGDCAQAICWAQGRPANRGGHAGYHPLRRFDLLGLEPPEAEGHSDLAGEEASLRAT